MQTVFDLVMLMPVCMVGAVCKAVPGGGPKLSEGVGAWAAEGDHMSPYAGSLANKDGQISRVA